MKRALYLCAIVFAMSQGVCSAQNSGDSLADRLRMTLLGQADNAVAITMEEITTATPEKRKLLAAAACQVVDDVFKVSPPWSQTNDRLIAASVYVLLKISDEDAIVAAFASRLGKIEPNAICERDVTYALGRCHNPAATEAIAKLARQRLKEITPWLPEPPPSTSEDQRKMINAQGVSFLHALEGLAVSNSISGKNTARELRDEFLRLFKGARSYEDVRADIEDRIDPLLKQGVQPSSRPSSTGGAVSRSSPNHRAAGTPAPVSVSSQTQGVRRIGMAIAAIVAVVVIVGFLIRFLRKK